MEYLINDGHVKTTLHAISPYVGKLRPDLVGSLIEEYTSKNDLVLDPFCGSGTVPLEAWIRGRRTLGIDLNYYAYVVTKAKLSPPSCKEIALKKLDEYNEVVMRENPCLNVNTVPEWVRDFFHPQTLAEVICWMTHLTCNEDLFFISCLLGILHHQRPGFLSYPSSHGAPYLRNDKYPQTEYPDMYEYRNVYERLKKKIVRTYAQIPNIDYSLQRDIIFGNALDVEVTGTDNVVIITSPPYMKSLTYARDNRLRLWFLGYHNWEDIDRSVSIGKLEFSRLMGNCFSKWSNIQNSGNYCMIIVGDIVHDKKTGQTIPELVCELAHGSGYNVVDVFNYPTNKDRKIVKADSKIKEEKICIFRKD